MYWYLFLNMLMSHNEVARRSEELAARVPRAEKPTEVENPLTLEMDEEGRATKSHEHAEAQLESMTEAGERKVAEMKAAAEERFGGFFAGMRSRMESIKNRAAQALFGAVGFGMEAGTAVRKTGGAMMDGVRGVPEAAKGVAGFVYDDLIEPTMVAPAKAIARGAATAGMMGVGLGVAGAVGAAGLAMEGGRRAMKAGTEAKERASAYSQEKKQELEGALVKARATFEGAKGGARTVAENALRSLESKKLDMQIRSGELRADAALKISDMKDLVSGKFDETLESIDARMEKYDTAVANAKELLKSKSEATRTAAENAIMILGARKLDAEIALKEATAAGKERAAAAGRAGVRGVKAVGRGAGTVAAVGAGAVILGAGAGYELGRRGVLGTIAGAEAVREKMGEVSTKGKERYTATMEALSDKLDKAVGFMEKMKLRLEIAKTVLGRSMNEIRLALTTDKTIAEHSEIHDEILEAIDDLSEVDKAAAQERAEAVA